MKTDKKDFDFFGGRTGLFVVYAVGLTIVLLQLKSFM